MSDRARQAALELLRAVREDDAYANLVLPQILHGFGLTGRDAAFATELGYGTLRGQGWYDAILATCVTRPYDRDEPGPRDVLRLGAHQELAMRVQEHVRERLPQWKREREGVEELKLAVMGCVVNGPGESKMANIGISLPGTGEAPTCPVYVDGQKFATLTGSYEELAARLVAIIDDYVATRYPER